MLQRKNPSGNLSRENCGMHAVRENAQAVRP